MVLVIQQLQSPYRNAKNHIVAQYQILDAAIPPPIWHWNPREIQESCEFSVHKWIPKKFSQTSKGIALNRENCQWECGQAKRNQKDTFPKSFISCHQKIWTRIKVVIPFQMIQPRKFPHMCWQLKLTNTAIQI